MTTAETKLTPMMIQWEACKKKAPDAILLFRLGDFYEAFHGDAIILSRELDLTLTKRGETPMAGVPQHTVDSYIDQLVAKGYRIAMAEQIEDPTAPKGLMKRDIVRVITPATSTGFAGEKQNNFFVSIHYAGLVWGVSVLDLTTGEFRIAEFEKADEVLSEVSLLRPSEILTSQKSCLQGPQIFEEIKIAFKPLITYHEEWFFEESLTHGFLTEHFKVHSLDGYGLKGWSSGIQAAGALLAFLRDQLSQSISHIQSISTYSTKDYLLLDRITLRNLELTESLFDQGKRNTLLEVLDKTTTPMGGRLLRQWIKQPLLSEEKIVRRQDAIEEFLKDRSLRQVLSHVKDLERLVMKISSNIAGPRDLIALKYSLRPIKEIKHLLNDAKASLIQELENSLKPLDQIVDLIDKSLIDEPPFRLTDGGFIKPGFDPNLDELKNLSSDSKEWMARYQAELKETSGIKTLKVGYTKISGFYIEVSRGQSDNVPSFFQRRQTLTNAERFITPELKNYEEKVLSAEEKTLRLELEIFRQLKEEIAPHFETILTNASAIGRLDALLSLSECANLYGYTRPLIDSGFQLNIRAGRHPVIEAAGREAFIPNDTQLDYINHSLMLITGPNMAGKSTYIRQVALIVIMAQMGSFVPAASAHIGLIDKVFTRIGASDDLTRGQSTFMVEMTETANILNNATNRSLVILDEIGRGTSTYDGISIAWSVAEYLLIQEGRRAKTLFATHYWELTKLEEKVPGAANYTVAVHESNDQIRFLRKITRGGTDKSYGIHVAKLAGLPPPVLERAKELLSHLEENANRKTAFEPSKPKKQPKPLKSTNQLSFL